MGERGGRKVGAAKGRTRRASASCHEYSLPLGVLLPDQYPSRDVPSARTLIVRVCNHVPQDAVHAKGRASAALQQAQQQLDQSSEHLNLLKKQLAEERLSNAALSANLDSVQAELAQCKTQVDHWFHHIARRKALKNAFCQPGQVPCM